MYRVTWLESTAKESLLKTQYTKTYLEAYLLYETLEYEKTAFKSIDKQGNVSEWDSWDC